MEAEGEDKGGSVEACSLIVQTFYLNILCISLYFLYTYGHLYMSICVIITTVQGSYVGYDIVTPCLFYYQRLLQIIKDTVGYVYILNLFDYGRPIKCFKFPLMP